MTVAIVGGGWAGIACALELAGAGRPATLYEAAQQLGGRARGVDWNGIRIDNGQHLMIGAYGETLRLLRRLGTAQLLERRPLDLRLPGFRLALPRLPAPLHLAAGLMLAQGLGLADKWAAARFMRGLQASSFSLREDLPAAVFLRRQRQPQRLIDRLWEPICVAALNTPVASASAQVFCNVLRDSLAGSRTDSDLLLNRADLGRLVGAAAQARLGQAARLGEKVGGITRNAGGFRLAGPERHAEQVVLAVHPGRLPALLAEFPDMAGIADAVAGFTWQPILTLWLRFAAPPAFPFPMLGLGAGQAPWAFERNDLAPGVVAIVMSADGPHLHLPAERLRDAYLALLARALGPLPALLDWKTITEKRATWSCAPNLPRPDNATPVRGLYLAGDYTAGDYPATLEGAVRSGVKCARLILSSQFEIQHSKSPKCLTPPPPTS
jgi:squalene-associated FAD-dependent desaturase